MGRYYAGDWKQTDHLVYMAYKRIALNHFLGNMLQSGMAILNGL